MTSQYHYSQSSFTQKFPNSDTFKFLVSTDTHLGYKEQDNIRKNDSFEAFEEVLQKAKDCNVDFLLLGGDLFHELNPSQETLYKCLKTLKDKIFGDKQIEYQTFWEDQAPNYSNENMNISLPIFIIHGNHDYPSNEYGNLSTLDLLHAGNYLNYFGKYTNYHDSAIEVKPILFHKKGTKIALYGLGNIKEIRLHYLLQNNKIKFTQPEENPETYFHILVIHQNRFKGNKNWSYKNSIHPKMFPNFFNLIIWGHEHESLPDIEQSEEIQAYIYQPGSSVATSLIEAETKTKHAGLFTFRKNEFYFEPLYLTNSQRNLIFKQIELGNFLKKKGNLMVEETNEEVEKYLEQEINGILIEYDKNNENQSQKEKNLKLPLLRLKIEYSGFDIIRIQRLEAKFKGKIANEGDILKFWKKKQEIDENAFEKNLNLTSRFSECFRKKVSFNTLGNESLLDIRSMYEESLKKTSFKILNPSIFLEKVDNINFRNRQTLLTDFFDSGLNKINSEIFQKEKGTMSKILSDFNERTGSQIEMLQKALKDPQMSKEILKEDFAPKNFEGQIFSFVDNLKKTVFTLTSHHINAVFKPEQIILEDSNKKEQTVAKEKKPRKNNKKNERNFFFDEEDGKSISTNISQNHKNQELTLNEEKKYEDSDPQDDFLEKDKKDYKVNVIGPESNIIQSNPVQKKKRNAGKTEKSLENKSKKKKASNQEKQQDYNMPEKSENKSVKFDENSNSKLPQKSFFDQYLNPKKRKEDMVITKPEKMEKKEPNIMNAEQFLGALLEKKDVPFKKQRVFANSPLGSKSKDKKSGDFF